MKILHTADWHLGRSLYGRKRYAEFSAFLDWLVETIDGEGVDALLVAGDVFDTSTPSNRAQELYYRFLCRVAASCCRHVVVIAGNHDSPSFLDAPKELLRALNVYVVGATGDDPADEVIVLRGEPGTILPAERQGQMDTNKHESTGREDHPRLAQMDAGGVEAIVCAVPYLRDQDIRTVEPGETIDDKNRKLVEGIQRHYEEVVSIAETKRENLRESAQSADGFVPIIAMGHLFTAGGKTVDGDGVRELYVGSLAHVDKEVFPPSIDYLALGHLHVPQVVGGAEHIRYSGSPIPMGYGEAKQQKSVVIVDFGRGKSDLLEGESFGNQRLKIQLLDVPCFQELVRLVGSLDDIHAKLEELKKEGSAAWIEVEYSGDEIIGDLREMLEEVMTGSGMEIRRIKNQRVMERVINTVAEDETLDDLDPGDVFTRCLDTFEVPDGDREELTASYKEIIKSLQEEDVNAE